MIFLFANPIAGRGRAARMAARISRAFESLGTHTRIFHTSAAELLDEQLVCGSIPKAAIVIGGDGTIRAVVERLLQFNGGDANLLPPILVVPLGTANLLAQHLHLQWDDHKLENQVVAAVTKMQIKRIDVARAGEGLVLMVASVGLDAAIVHELAQTRRGPITKSSYALPALNALQRFKFHPLTIEIDGRHVVNSEPAMAFVGNIPEYGTGFPILARADSSDGLLDLCVLPCRSHLQLIKLFMLAMSADHITEEDVIYTTGRSIRIDSPSPAPVQIDGEAGGYTPLTVDLLPSKLPFIVQ